ncbi:MAG: hypothetical protein COB54_02855 [Alphaproteobacteria bacterium]|nr:MAG: hypothetical protein COB54_02855 [Alphaproteobacteria bacterium]
MKLITLCFLTLMFMPSLVLASEPINTMATVLVDLNHYPSAEHKKSLTAIIGNSTSTESEKLLATIITRIAHKASDADKILLSKILSDESEPEAIKTLAKAILNIKHKPQGDDIEALKALMGTSPN